MCVCCGGGGVFCLAANCLDWKAMPYLGGCWGGGSWSPPSHTHTHKNELNAWANHNRRRGGAEDPAPPQKKQTTPNTTTNQPNKPTNRNQQNRKNYGAVTTVRCRSSLFTVTSGWKCSVWIVFRERAGHRSCSGYYFFFSLVVWCWQVLGISVGPAIVEVVKLVLIEICFFMICSAFSCWNQISGVW